MLTARGFQPALTFFTFYVQEASKIPFDNLLPHPSTHDDPTEVIAIMSAREDTVLRPIDPSITDENDWPDFDLVDVKVLRPGKMLYANLLDATEQNPVQVIGCLELRGDQNNLRAYSITCLCCLSQGASYRLINMLLTFAAFLV